MALGSLLPELRSGGTGLAPLVERVARWAAEKPDAPAFTFVDYSLDPAGVKITLSWAETDRRARAMAARLRRSAGPGERAALLLPQNHEYMMTMLGAMYARVVAVPLFSPDQPGHGERLVGVYNDADPTVVVTTRSAEPHVEKFLADNDVPRPREIIIAEEVPAALAGTWPGEPIDPSELAYLQYTSGSTRTPAGVEITHGNLAANAEQLWAGWAPDKPDPELVTWLPLFHDMGLMSAMGLPLVYGDHVIYTAPLSFLMRPMRWLQLISECDNVYTAAPNFAYEYVVEHATPEKVAELDLSGLVTCLNGAEPVRASTMAGFAEAFAAAGVRPGAMAPAFGLAEATVFVTASAEDAPATVLTVDREALALGGLALRDEGAERATTLVSCGRPVGQFVAIVDPDTRAERPDGQVGEIWVHGPNNAPGYWRNPERTTETFRAELADPDGLPAGPWMRTGDYGVVHDGELYVTGRVKDLIIVDGRNHYPQDLEVTTQESHPAIRPEFVAAFAVDGGETERLVVVAERNRRVPLARLDLDEVHNAVRGAVNVEHEMSVHDFVLIEPGGLSRTSSGKVARAATRQRYLDGALPTTRARLDARR